MTLTHQFPGLLGPQGEVMVNSSTQETSTLALGLPRSTAMLDESLPLLGLSYVIYKMGKTTSVLPTSAGSCKDQN